MICHDRVTLGDRPEQRVGEVPFPAFEGVHGVTQGAARVGQHPREGSGAITALGDGRLDRQPSEQRDAEHGHAHRAPGTPPSPATARCHLRIVRNPREPFNAHCEPGGPRVVSAAVRVLPRAFERGRSIGRALLLGTLVIALAMGSIAAACHSGPEVVEPLAEPEEEPATREVAEPEPPRRGLWVLAEGARRVLDHPERIPELLQEAAALGATDLFVQVYRGGRAWYDTEIADPTPFRRNLENHGIDTVATLLRDARAAGFRVHAWVNVLSLSRNTKAPILRDLGRDVVLSDRRGRSLLDYPRHDVPPPDRAYYRMGTPGVYLDPAAPGVAERLAETFTELLTRYPSFDGLHLDYARYPDVLPFAPGSRFGVGLDFGYGESTRARFLAETGKRAPLGDSLGNASAWDRWRREKLDALIAGVATSARDAREGLVMSGAVWTYADRGYLVLGQDWRRWLEEGWLDVAIPMSYTVDDRLLRYLVEHFQGLPLADRIWVGLGTWLFAKNPARAVRQMEIAEAAGADDLVLFSYDSIVSEPALYEALRAEGRGGP